MGRTIKISELKKFDVFKPSAGNLSDIYPDLFYIVFDDGFCCTWNQGYQFRINDFVKDEVQLLGRMEFKPEEIIAEHICDNRCLGDSGHHAWPSPKDFKIKEGFDNHLKIRKETKEEFEAEMEEEYYRNNQGAQ